MPSFHAGWNLLAGIVVFGATRSLVVRAFAVAMPAAMAFAVIATANHFVIDVVAGTLIVLAVLPFLHRRSGLRSGALSFPDWHRVRHPRRRRRRARLPAMNRLLVPALDRGGAAEVLLGFLTGGLVLGVSDVVIPHAHARLREGARQPVEQRAAEHRAALEGFAAAAPLIPAGTSPRTAAGVAALTGWSSRPPRSPGSRSSARRRGARGRAGLRRRRDAVRNRRRADPGEPRRRARLPPPPRSCSASS